MFNIPRMNVAALKPEFAAMVGRSSSVAITTPLTNGFELRASYAPLDGGFIRARLSRNGAAYDLRDHMFAAHQAFESFILQIQEGNVPDVYGKV